MQEVPNPIKINNKSISFPYINRNINADPVSRLLVDIIEFADSKPSNFVTASLKYVFCEYYPQYSQYLRKHIQTALRVEINNYYSSIIQTEIEYKYKVGQFGYIYNANASNSLEQSFVIITEISDTKREIFFLHEQLKKYKFRHYDITSPTPKVLLRQSGCQSAWIIGSLFAPIADTIDNSVHNLTNNLIELLNWKICREDYLLKKMNRMQRELKENTLELKENMKFDHFVKIHKMENSQHSNLSEYTQDSDDEQTSYLPDSEQDYKSSYYTSNGISTDNDGANTNVTVSSMNTSTDTGDDEKLLLLADHGYYEEQHLCYTLKGELFVALDKNKKSNRKLADIEEEEDEEEEVAIKKFESYTNSNGFRIVIDAHLIKEALIHRQLKTENTLVRNSIVKYIDFFQSKTHYFSVMEKNFSVNLKEFVTKCHGYIKSGKLALSEYHETIKYLLWRLTATINWLHNDMRCCDLDVCPENIMLSRAEFTQNSDGSVAINLQIEMKFVDFGVRELLELCNYDKLKEFKCRYNDEYIQLKNEQYITPQYYDPRAADMWSFGMVIYYCFFGSYPYNAVPNCNSDSVCSSDSEGDSESGYWSVYNGKLNEYIKTKSSLKFIDPKVLSLINGLLNIDETKRLRSIDVLKHTWFNSFYKAYLSIRNDESDTTE